MKTDCSMLVQPEQRIIYTSLDQKIFIKDIKYDKTTKQAGRWIPLHVF